MDTGYLARIASLYAPVFYFSCMASAAVHCADLLAFTVSPFYYIGALLLFGLVAVRCLFARVVSTKTVLVLGSTLLALAGAAYCLYGRLWVSSAVFYILLWGIGLKFCADSLLWCTRLVWARSVPIFATLAALLGLGSAFGALLGYRINCQIGLQDLVFAGFLVGSVLEVLVKMRRICTAAGLSKEAIHPLAGVPSSALAELSSTTGASPMSHAPIASQGFLERYGDVCRSLAETFQLTKREGEVLFFVARGYKAAYCAHALGIAETTVRSHIRSIYNKTGTYSSDGLINMVENCLNVAGRETACDSPRWRPARPRR